MHPFVLHDTLGAAYIGVMLAAILHGVSIVQAWYYFGHQNDRWTIKGLVTAVMVFDTIHQALIIHTIYSYTITYWGEPEELDKLVWSLIVEVLFNGLTAFLVQSFLTLRIWRLSNRSILLTGFALCLVFAEFGVLLAYTGLALDFDTYEQLAKLKALSITVNALAAAGDVMIAVTLCSILHFSRTGFHRSDTMINKLILYSVNTGVLTSLCAIGSLISIVFAGQTFYYIGFFFCIGRLYTNSLLATLNARKKIRGCGESSDHVSLSLRDCNINTSTKLTNASVRRGANISIKIDTTKEFASDLAEDNDTEKLSESVSSGTNLEKHQI
ncbi:hypothetical protein CPB83DRAFT_610299 [Crepidotus variabilis]|uniref:DUF6534 domain-containing protein n=1 Tax=Crepidotus variabilis TaxID=179855 RepID=A0A9P6JKY9_9AGAR|nr:hypothetical protein CPB83DRAFT_610299 [Crepidotus variabilis]